MPVIRIPDSIYTRLQAIAVPFEDTPIDVIERLLNTYEATYKPQPSAEKEIYRVIDPDNPSNLHHTKPIRVNAYEATYKPQPSAEKEIYRLLDSDNPSNLHHTKLIQALIGGSEISRPDWAKIVDKAHIVASQQGLSLDDLIKKTRSNVVKGESSSAGFRYLPEINISVQGVDANKSWSNALYLAKFVKVPIEVCFEWRNNEKAAYPGEKGKLIWIPPR